MPRLKTGTALLMTAIFAACGGADETADAADQAEMATAPASASMTDSECFLRGATLAEAAERPSPLRTTAFAVGGTQGLICYGAPSARGRVMVGGVDPYGELWRTGANEATAIHLEGPATVGGIALEAGSYSLYTRPNEDSWEVFLNSSFERWGIPISDEVRATEIGSFEVTPEAIGQAVETLSYEWNSTGNNAGEIVIEWENTRVRIPVTAGM
jgi:hypothetical protein